MDGEVSISIFSVLLFIYFWECSNNVIFNNGVNIGVVVCLVDDNDVLLMFVIVFFVFIVIVVVYIFIVIDVNNNSVEDIINVRICFMLMLLLNDMGFL